MSLESRLVFDEVVEDRSGTLGTITTYSSLDHTQFLADAQQIVMHVITEATSTIGTLNIAIETSGDGRSWHGKQAAPEFQGLLSALEICDGFRLEIAVTAPGRR